MSLPYEKIKNDKEIKFKLDDKQYALTLGKHYSQLK